MRISLVVLLSCCSLFAVTPIQVSPLNSASANVTLNHNTYHFHHLGAIWDVTAFQSASSRHLQIWKSTDNAATWSEQDSANEPPIGLLGMFWDGVADNIYFIIQNVSTHVCQVYTFSTLTGMYGGALGAASPAITAVDIGHLVQYTDGTFRLYYLVGANNDLHFRNFDGVATWGADTPVRVGVSGAAIAEILQNADVTHFIYNVDNTLTGWHYLRVNKAGTLTNDFTFPYTLQEMGNGGAGTNADGIIEGTTIAFPAVLQDGNHTVVIFRGSPVTNPTWAAPETIDSSGLDASTPTLVVDNLGNERAFWFDTDDTFTFSATSTIRTSTHSGGVWSPQVTYYSIALNPYSDPNPLNCENDQMFNLGVEWFGDAAWVQFDGTSPNNYPGGSQPNFAFIGETPPPPPAVGINYILSGGPGRNFQTTGPFIRSN